MNVFLPGFLIALLALAWWGLEVGVPRYVEFMRKENCRAQGLCECCEMALSHCTCVVFEPWDDE